MEQSAVVDHVVVVSSSVQMNAQDGTVSTIVRTATHITEHSNNVTAALQSSWKTISVAMKFVDDDADEGVTSHMQSFFISCSSATVTLSTIF